MPNEQNWNEIQFLSWDKFKNMTPSIVQLEITRITKLLRTGKLELDDHNALVRVRFALKQFLECLETAKKETFQESCANYVTRALMSMPASSPTFDVETAKTLEYIVDRIKDVHQRISLIY